MQNGKTTKMTMYANKAIGIISSLHGSNVNAVAFNIDLIAPRKPLLAIEIMRLYNEIRSLEISDPIAHDEDQDAATEELRLLIQKAFGK